MSERAFCSYFDHRYLPRALAMIESLRANGCNDEVWVLCLSQTCRDILERLALANIRLVDLSALEEAYPQLHALRSQRSPIEFYFTCTPLIVEYVFAHQPEAGMVTYLDGDLYFFDRVESVFEEIGDAPVAIIPHNYPPKLARLKKFGTYNVGWVSFRRTSEGAQCLRWWAERCLEWCFDEVAGDGRFADQGYLDNFSAHAPHLCVIRHPGMNTAPWNVDNYAITASGDHVFINDRPLVFFHFQGLRQAWKYFFFASHRYYRARMGKILRNRVYLPYVRRLLYWSECATPILDRKPAEKALPRGSQSIRERGRAVLRNLVQIVLKLMDLLTGRAILAVKGKVY